MVTSSQNISAIFPKVTSTNFTRTSPETRTYNCIAWAANDNTRWWEPDRLMLYYWPPNAKREYTLSAFMEAFTSIGFSECSDGLLETNFVKVALYGTPACLGVFIPTHAARQLPDGKWTSKLGTNIDVIHETEFVLCGPQYGEVIRYLKRPK